MTEPWRPLGRLDFSLIESLRLQRFGRGDPSAHVERERYTKAAWTPAGPVVLDVAQNESGHAGFRLIGPGAASLAPRIAEVLGLADPGPPPELLSRPGLGHLADALRLLRLTASISIFEIQCALILQQRVTFAEAARAWRLMARSTPPSPRVHDSPPLAMPPRPADWRALSQPAARALGIDSQRWATLRAAAEHADKITALEARPIQDARAAVLTLTGRLRGHGPWTVGFLLGLALADPDAVPLGDVHLPHDLASHFTGIPHGSDARMLELLEPFSGHRFRVIRALVAGTRRSP